MGSKVSTRKKLFDENRRYWGECKYSEKRGYICIVHTLPWHLEWGMTLGIIAKGLQEKEKLPVVGFSIGNSFDSFEVGDESFGFTGLSYDIENDYVKNFDKDELLEEIVNRCYGNKDAILALEYRGISCGDSFWEMLIACSPYLDCARVDKAIFIHTVKQVLTIVDLAYQMFEKYPPKYFMIDEPVRLAGLYSLVAAKMGAEIVASRMEVANYPVILSGSSFTLQGMFVKEARLRVESATVNKEEAEKEQFVYELPDETNEMFSMKTNRNKNVFIMLHQFNDATREACEHYIYRDYLEWFLDTLNIIKNIRDVNWIIRDHPFGTGSLQRKVVKDIFEQYESDNIIWCEDSVNRESILECADVIITYCGDVGLEYWAKGKPTVTLANAYYADFGISYRMKNRKEYIETLYNIDKLEKPSKESIKDAHNMILRTANSLSREDELAFFLHNIHKKEVQGIKYERRNYDLYEYELIKGYLKLLYDNKLKKSECYLLKKMVREDERE